MKKENPQITLTVESRSEPEEGIFSERIEITMPFHYIAPDGTPEEAKRLIENGGMSLRKEMKDLFANACEDLFDFGVDKVYFEDEKE